MPARLSAFVIWALVAAGLMFWGYRLGVSPMAAPANVQAVSESPGVRGDLTRMLGVVLAPASVAPVPVAESSRFRLLGVLAPKPPSNAAKPSTAGVALIAVDGKPPRAYAVGSRLDNDMVLQSIARRSASIGPAQGAATVVLELPPPQAPTTGTLPKAVADAEPARTVAPAPPPQAQRQPQPVDQSADDAPVPPPPRRGASANPANR